MVGRTRQGGQRRLGAVRVKVSSLDNDGDRGFGVKLASGATAGDDGSWHGSSLDQAARPTGVRHVGTSHLATLVLAVMLVPVSGMAAAMTSRKCTGRLAGSSILYDRDEDGQYGAVGAHWTAAACADADRATACSRSPVTIGRQGHRKALHQGR